MANPSVFIHIETQEQKALLESIALLQQFDVVQSDSRDTLVAELSECAPELAIIEADHLSASQHGALQNAEIAHQSDFIFLSQGEPNPFIDALMKKGAGIHCRAPIDTQLIEEVCQETLEDFVSSSKKGQAVKTSQLDQFGLLVGSSSAMHKLYRAIRRGAKSLANVLIVGESGAGKELVANTIHLVSERADKPFIAVNCGALSPELIDSELFGHTKGAFTGAVSDHVGVFEQAKGGTLFLDEVTEMPIEHQVKLLRVLETGDYKPVGSEETLKTDVRIVAATNRDPQQAVQDGILREDVYFRLAHFPITVPPLRERGDDILGLAEHFIAYRNAKESRQLRFSSDALKAIAAHAWPGNVRELKHVIERAAILADEQITEAHLVLDTPVTELGSQLTVPPGMSLEDIEREAITQTLAENDGNKTITAQQLGISVKTLYNKLDKYQTLDS